MNTEDEKNDHSNAYFEKLFIDAVRRYSDDEEDPLRNNNKQLSDDEILKLIFVRQAHNIRTIKSFFKFFVYLAVASLVIGFIVLLAVVPH